MSGVAFLLGRFAAMGVRVVGIVTNPSFAEAQTIVKALGPWGNCNLEFFSIARP